MIMASGVHVEAVGPEKWRDWRDLRCEALVDTPIGFAEVHSDVIERTDEDWQATLRHPGYHVIAYGDDGKPLGMSGGLRNEAGERVLWGAFVRPAVRGQGIMEAMVDAVVAWAGPEPLLLHVHEDNLRAQRAYLRVGFVFTGERKVGGGIDGRDLLEMRRPAPAPT